MPAAARRYAENCTQFAADEVPVEDEFLRVECSEDDAVVYRDMFGFTPLKAPLPADDNAVDVVDPDTPRVSVLIIGADSVSRSNLLRQMPQTVRVLQEIGAIDMLGYNKVRTGYKSEAFKGEMGCHKPHFGKLSQQI